MNFFVNGPPVPKARARVVSKPGQRAHAVTPAKTRAYEAHVKAHAMGARSREKAWRTNAPGYAVTILVYRKPGARGDLDNYVKGILDGCDGVAWEDDRRVRKLAAELVESTEIEGVEVMIAESEQTDPRWARAKNGAVE